MGLVLGSQPEPIANGTLAETPLCHVALYLYRRNSSGTLVIDAGKRTETRIRFARGRPVAARIPFAREGLLACLLPLCGLRAGVFEFFEADLVGEDDNDVVQGVVDPYELITASLDEHGRDDMVDALLTRFADTKLRIQPGRDLERLRLPPRDRTLLELIRAAPASPRDLIAQAPLPQLRTRRLLYVLIATHMVSPHQERDDSDNNYRSQVDLGAEAGSVPINDIAASGARGSSWPRCGRAAAAARSGPALRRLRSDPPARPSLRRDRTPARLRPSARPADRSRRSRRCARGRPGSPTQALPPARSDPRRRAARRIPTITPRTCDAWSSC